MEKRSNPHNPYDPSSRKDERPSGNGCLSFLNGCGTFILFVLWAIVMTLSGKSGLVLAIVITMIVVFILNRFLSK